MILGALAIATVSAQSGSPPAVRPDSTLPDGPGKGAFMSACGNCHSPEKVVGALKTRAEWRQTLDDMVRFGAEASDQDISNIHEYLVAHFSPIAVNTATAQELAATLDIAPEVAGAIVRFRGEKGTFTSIDDLSNVPGLDAAKLDARKKRLLFQ